VGRLLIFDGFNESVVAFGGDTKLGSELIDDLAVDGVDGKGLGFSQGLVDDRAKVGVGEKIDFMDDGA
jgi:hypothetical protein